MPDERETVRSVDDLVRLGADATVAISWARKTRWRGTWDTTVGGRAHATVNGSIHLTSEQARDLREMFAGAGQEHSKDALTRYRAAIQALLREHSRLLVRPGYDRRRAAAIADEPWARVLDQGVAELWAARNVDAFIDELGLEQVAPGLKSVQAEPEYAREAAAAEGLTLGVKQAWNWEAEDVELSIHRRAPHQKLEWLASSWYEARELEFLVPQHSQHVARLRVERAYRDSLDQIDGVSGDNQARILDICARHGATAVLDAATELAELRKEYDNPQLIEFLTKGAKEAVHRIVRPGQSAHGGALDDTKLAGGIAAWDGRMHLHNKHVVQPLREMFANAGKQHDEQTLRRFRWAVGVILHEHAHFAIPDADNYRLSAGPFGDRKWLRWGEEGFVEAFNSAYLDDFIKETGIDKVAPGILDVDSGETYESFAPAMRAIAEGLDERTGLPREALRRQAATSPREQWDELADQMFEISRLPDLVPPQDLEWVKRQIGDAMRTHIAWLDENTTWLDDNADPAKDENPKQATVQQTRELSTLRGKQAFEAGMYTIQSLEQLYGSPTVQALYQARLAAQRGLAPETASSYEFEPGPVRERPWEGEAERLYRDSKLPGVVPEPEVFHAQRAIEKALADYVPEAGGDPEAGRAAAGRAMVEQLESRYSSPDSRALYQSLLAANSGVAAAGARSSTAPAATTEELPSQYSHETVFGAGPAAGKRGSESPVRGG